MPAGRSCSSPTTWPCKMQSLGSQPIPSLLQPQNLLAQDTSTAPDWFLQKESLLPALCTLSPLLSSSSPLFTYLFQQTADLDKFCRAERSHRHQALQAWRMKARRRRPLQERRPFQKSLCHGCCLCQAPKAVSPTGSEFFRANAGSTLRFQLFQGGKCLTTKEWGSNCKAETTSCHWRSGR